MAQSSRKKVERQRRFDRPSPYPTMERKGGNVLSNPGDAPKNDQTRTPTRDQDQEGDGEGRNPEADADVPIEFLLSQIQARKAEKRELELRLDAARKELRRVEADNRSIAVHAHFLEGRLARIRRDLASSSKDHEAEADRLKRALKDLEADKAKLDNANTVLLAEISELGTRLLAAAEGEAVDVGTLMLRYKLMEMTLLRITEHLRHSKEMAEVAVKEKIRLGEAREEDLKRVVDAFEELKTQLESAIAEVRSDIDRHLETQSEHDAAMEAIAWGLKFSWKVAAVVSVGALLAVAVTVYNLLRIVRYW